jgi:hypothetical protein
MAAKVYMTIGNGVELGMDQYDHLFVRTQTDRDRWDHVDLGKATKKRFEQLKEYLDRLSIHAVEEKVL